jgi:hypothetical protein
MTFVCRFQVKNLYRSPYPLKPLYAPTIPAHLPKCHEPDVFLARQVFIINQGYLLFYYFLKKMTVMGLFFTSM